MPKAIVVFHTEIDVPDNSFKYLEDNREPIVEEAIEKLFNGNLASLSKDGYEEELINLMFFSSWFILPEEIWEQSKPVEIVV